MFSKKQELSILESHKKINIFEGSTRGGKTYAANVRFLTHVLTSRHNLHLLTGKTVDTLYTNVLQGEGGLLQMFKNFGIYAKYKANTAGGNQIMVVHPDTKQRKILLCKGANDALQSMEKIRGLTLGGWLGDEATSYSQEFTNMALSRLQFEDALAFLTMNPDHPKHYIKVDYIDKAHIREDIAHFHFNIEDNPILTPKEIQSYYDMFTGVFLQRMVHGLWVMAEGLIYGKQPKVCKANEVPRIVKYFRGADGGTNHFTVFLLGGLGEDGKIYILDELVENNTAFSVVVDKYRDYSKSWGWSILYLDPSADGLQKELELKGVNVKHADNSVMEGIGAVSSLIAQDKLVIVDKCTQLLSEFPIYRWGKNDKPVKENDDALDALRYLIQSNYSQI